MTAKDYPITFDYGAVDGVYYGPHGSVGPYHRGQDRAMPNGTPVIVNGIEIGKSNNTGASSGSHLHIGRFVGGADTNPDGNGLNLKPPVTVTTVAQDNTNGNYVRLTDGDGVQWVYLHLQSQSVKQGQELKGEDMPALADRGFVINRFRQILNREPNEQDIAVYLNKPREQVYDALLDSNEFKARLDGKINGGDVINWVRDHDK